MDYLPDDLPSFIWGLLVAFILIVITGFGREIGKDIYAFAKKRLGEPEPLQISVKYLPKSVPPDQCVWVREENIPHHENEGSTFYPHPDNRGGKCYRLASMGTHTVREYLMVRKQR